MDVDKLAKEFEDIYKNSCYKKDPDNEKCLALDEQELAIIYMCLETLVNSNGYDKNKYRTDGLFILLKDDLIGSDECNDLKISEQLLRYKKCIFDSNYSLKDISDYLLIYYAVLLFYANENHTEILSNKSNRYYFKVYAYFACICPKTFSVLFFNQMYLFMEKTYSLNNVDMLNKYLDNTEMLWKEYNLLLEEEECIKISEQMINQFREILAYDKKKLIDNLIKFEDLRCEGFLAFDFREGDTIEESRYKKILNGIQYFKWYLVFLENRLSHNLAKENKVYEFIKNILKNAEQLDKKFCKLLKNKGDSFNRKEINFADMNEFFKSFRMFCNEELIYLIDV